MAGVSAIKSFQPRSYTKVILYYVCLRIVCIVGRCICVCKCNNMQPRPTVYRTSCFFFSVVHNTPPSQDVYNIITLFDRFDRYCHRTGTDSSGRPLNKNVFYFIIYSSFARSTPTVYSVFYRTIYYPISLCACSGSWFRALSERLHSGGPQTNSFLFVRLSQLL